LIDVNFNKLGRLGIIVMFLVAFHTRNDAMGLELKGRVVFSTQNELLIINLEDEGLTKSPTRISLPNKLDTAHNPSWMPNGQQVIFEYTPWNAQQGSAKRYLAVADTKSKKVYAFANDLIQKKESYTFPVWSPNGKFLAFLDHKDTELVKGNNDTIIQTKYFNRLMICEWKAEVFDTVDQVFAARSPISWSSDNRSMAFCTSDDEIAVHYLHSDTKILIKGSYPTFNPVTHEVYYVCRDGHLYKMRVDGKEQMQMDGGDWSWRRIVSISNDGTNLLFIGTGSFLLTEYSTINAFNIITHEIEQLSERYPIIHGASLFEGP
jgi:Tol biopolymer transport system component